jgi:hypothetical protein
VDAVAVVVQPINATAERQHAVDFTSGVTSAGVLYYLPAGSGYTSVNDLNKPSVTIATITGSAEEAMTNKLFAERNHPLAAQRFRRQPGH